MEYWSGRMDWPLDKDWICETCGDNYGLEWGMVHAQCRCNHCHTEYSMRDTNEERTILTAPRCMLKDEYKEPIKLAYAQLAKPINEITMEELQEFKGAAK